MTTDEQWLAAIGIVRELGDLGEDERARALDDRCGGDASLRAAVNALLADHDEDSVGIWDSVDEQLGIGVLGDDPKLFPSVPGVELLEVLGRGGSGDVFAGRQDSPAREVAVKVLRTGLGSRRAVQRFDREARALAAIDHEAVASIYSVAEATLPGGAVAPCLLMELVRGRTLRDLETPMPAEAAARLVSSIARGLHAAHQRGIVHRDLKPSNVLIDDRGRPKIIDFGVATLTADHAQMTMQTMTGELLGTLGYMSPEQLDGSGDVVDVRTDVYALGVLFYELVEGKPAVDAGSGSSFAAIQTVTQGALPRLAGGGDADAIYRKATAHEPRLRYDSAASFADDLDRFIEGRPVVARAPSTLYSARLFVRRHPVSVGLGALAAVLVVGLSVATAVGFVSASNQRDAALLAEAAASRERDAAQLSERRATEASQFLRDMLSSPDPEIDGPSVRVVDLLDRSAALVGERYADEPMVAMDLHRTLGWTYAAISVHDKALPHFERALELASAELSEDADEVLQLRIDQADALVYLAEVDEAIGVLRSVLAACETSETVSLDTELSASIGLAEAVRNSGGYEEAEELFQRVIERSERELGPNDKQTIAALSGYGRALLDMSRTGEALGVFQTVRDRVEARGERDTPGWFTVLGNIGISLAGEGRHDEAIELYEDVLERGEAAMGEDHYTLRMVRNIVGDSYMAVGRTDDALRMGQRAIDDSARVNGENHPDTFLAMSNHAVMLIQLDRHAEALPLTERIAADMPAALGEDHPSVMVGLRNHAVALEGVDRADEAVDIYKDLIDRQTRVVGEASFDTLVTKNNLSFLLYRLGRFDESLVYIEEVMPHVGVDSGYPPFIQAAFLRNHGRSLLGVGRLDDAEAVLRRSIAADPENESNVEKSGALLDEVLAAQASRGG